MKKYLLLVLSSLPGMLAMGQNIPIDFEPDGYGADWTWTTFENDTNPALEIVSNPDPSGVNTSATVAKFTALQTGMPFAGCETSHGAGIGTFTIDSSTMIITISVWKSVISDVGIKLVREDGWSLGEIKVANTLVNQWEEITFDFSTHLGLTYDQIVIFPDFSARDADQVVYFDNVFGMGGTTSIADPQSTRIQLFPNPTQDHLTIRSDDRVEEVGIYDTAGTLVRYEQGPGENFTLDIAHLSKGMYVVKAQVNGRTVVHKFIKN